MTTNNKNLNNYWANTGLVLGITSIFFAFVGIIPLSGLVISLIGISKARSMNNKGLWQAVIGLLLSVVFTIVYLKNYGYI